MGLPRLSTEAGGGGGCRVCLAEAGVARRSRGCRVCLAEAGVSVFALQKLGLPAENVMAAFVLQKLGLPAEVVCEMQKRCGGPAAATKSRAHLLQMGVDCPVGSGVPGVSGRHWRYWCTWCASCLRFWCIWCDRRSPLCSSSTSSHFGSAQVQGAMCLFSCPSAATSGCLLQVRYAHLRVTHTYRRSALAVTARDVGDLMLLNSKLWSSFSDSACPQLQRQPRTTSAPPVICRLPLV